MIKLFNLISKLSWLITLGLFARAAMHHTLLAHPIITHNVPHGVLGWSLVISFLLMCVYQFVKLIFGQPKK